ncbi:MAG: putative transcriptional regulator [Psychroserpens sp.]|jgi:putative transcriptional regulator
MIKCHLSTLLGQKKLKVAEVARDTGINKNTLHRLYNETATRVEMEVIEKLCVYLSIDLNELFSLDVE